MKSSSLKKEREETAETEIDLLKLLQALLKKLWLIILCAVIIGGGAFAYMIRFSIS